MLCVSVLRVAHSNPYRPVHVLCEVYTQKLKAAGDISPTMIDVFCEKGFFDAAQTKRILEVHLAYTRQRPAATTCPPTDSTG